MSVCSLEDYLKVITGEYKTTQMIEWLKQGRTESDNSRLLIVINEMERQRLIKEYELQQYEVIGIRQYTKANKEIMFDNADLYLTSIFMDQLVGISITLNKET